MAEDVRQEVDRQRLLAELTQAISVLENYGDHHGWCDWAEAPTASCNCGFDREMATLRMIRDSHQTPLLGRRV